jgi:hypothetical protein
MGMRNMRKSIKDDDIYGPIRAEICDAYIVAGKPKPERNWLYSRLLFQHPRLISSTDTTPSLGTGFRAH